MTTKAIQSMLTDAGFSRVETMHRSRHIFATGHPNGVEFYGDMMFDGSWKFGLRFADSMEMIIASQSEDEDSAAVAAEFVIAGI